MALLLAGSGLAGATDDDNTVFGIRERLKKLKIIYTDDHPDVQILKRRLQRAQEEEERKRQAEAAQAGAAQAGAPATAAGPPAAPASPAPGTAESR